MSDKDIFRREAIESLTDRMGNPIKGVGVGMRVAAVFSVAVVAVAITFLATASYARKEMVPGWIVPDKGAIEVFSSRPGVIERVFVRDGQQVAVGDAVMSVSTETRSGDGTVLGEVIEASISAQVDANRVESEAASELADNRVAEMRQRQAMLHQQVAAFESDIALERKRLALADRTVSDLDALVESKLVSSLQYRDAVTSRIAASHGLLSVQRDAASLRHALGQVKLELRSAEAHRNAERAQLAEARLALEEKLANTRAGSAFIVTARAAGRITSLRAKPGATVGPDRAVAIIVPSGSTLHAELWVPSSAIGFLAQGADVHLMYDAFPYQKYGVATGKIAAIASAPVDLGQLPQFIRSEEARYRVLVDLDRAVMPAYGRDHPLIPGMRLTADLVLEQRSLLEWILEPLIAMRHRQGVPAAH